MMLRQIVLVAALVLSVLIAAKLAYSSEPKNRYYYVAYEARKAESTVMHSSVYVTVKPGSFFSMKQVLDFIKEDKKPIEGTNGIVISFFTEISEETFKEMNK